jgi:hypothetical protein
VNGSSESPVGAARQAFEAGDLVFQCSFQALSQRASVSAFAVTEPDQMESDASELLNGICREGWELVDADFVFVPTRESTRNKWILTGSEVSVGGVVIGYYVFKRNEEDHPEQSNGSADES